MTPEVGGQDFLSKDESFDDDDDDDVERNADLYIFNHEIVQN